MKLKNIFLTKKGDMTLVATLKIVLSVIGIGILAYLFVSIIGLAVDRNENQKFVNLLTDMNNKLDSTDKEHPSTEYALLSADDWYLSSFEKYEGVYECNSFCLCFCDEDDCSDKKICRPTNNFVMLKGKDGKEYRTIEIKEVSVELGLSYIDKEVYPYTAGGALESSSTIIPLYYLFSENKWKWSPDLDNWMNTSQLEVTGGVWKGQSPVQENQDFINLLNRQTNSGKSKEAGVALLESFTSLSKGIVTLQVK